MERAETSLTNPGHRRTVRDAAANLAIEKTGGVDRVDMEFVQHCVHVINGRRGLFE
jgi:hypothetical protein